MGKSRIIYRCTECGSATSKWGGRCGVCAAWNSLVEHEEAGDHVVVPTGPSSPARPIGEIERGGARPRPTGIGELDRVLGGGLVPGSVTLLGGEPGIGKSTLVLQLLAGWPERSLYVSAEESAQQVRLRAERLGAVQPDLWLLPETSLPRILATIEEVKPSLLVVDSIQTIGEPSLPSAPGSVVQVRGCAQRLVAEAKQRDLPVLMVGHVTKECGLAGPRALEHIVDTVLAFGAIATTACACCGPPSTASAPPTGVFLRRGWGAPHRAGGRSSPVPGAGQCAQRPSVATRAGGLRRGRPRRRGAPGGPRRAAAGRGRPHGLHPCPRAAQLAPGRVRHRAAPRRLGVRGVRGRWSGPLGRLVD
jgi:hypothetical protein